MTFRILAIIPARAGSKGLRGKNIRKINGSPLLQRAISLAQNSKRPGEDWTITVSTDSPRYATIARASGAIVPQLRPKSLAGDSCPLIDAILYTHRLLTDSHPPFDAILMLPPTTPLTLPTDVRRGIGLYHKVQSPSVISVIEEQVPPSWRFRQADGKLSQVSPGAVGRRQEASPEYRLNGALYIAEPAWLENNGQFFKNNVTTPLVMPATRSLDIETYQDLLIARKLLQTEPAA